MTTMLPGMSFSQDAPVNSVKRMAIAVSDRRLSDAIEDSHEEWPMMLRCLQQMICELLVMNQQLRWALMEVKEREPSDNEVRSKASEAITG